MTDTTLIPRRAALATIAAAPAVVALPAMAAVDDDAELFAAKAEMDKHVAADLAAGAASTDDWRAYWEASNRTARLANDACDRFAETPARTLRGMLAKLETNFGPDGGNSDDMAEAVMADLERLIAETAHHG